MRRNTASSNNAGRRQVWQIGDASPQSARVRRRPMDAAGSRRTAAAAGAATAVLACAQNFLWNATLKVRPIGLPVNGS